MDEWVKIDLDGDEGYLYKDYVNVGAKLEEALSISELMYGSGVSDVRVALTNFAKQYIGCLLYTSWRIALMRWSANFRNIISSV